jgi:hypothetical protein
MHKIDQPRLTDFKKCVILYFLKKLRTKGKKLMKKTIGIVLAMILINTVAFAKDKLYIVNTGSTGGSYNGQLSAMASDLSNTYNIEFVQSKGCAKGSANIKRITEAGEQVLYIWNALRTADNLNGKKDADCFMLPTKKNFVNSALKYAMFFTNVDGISAEQLWTDGTTVAYNSASTKDYLTAVAKSKGVTWNFIPYKNSKAVVLAVMNKEVQAGFVNSASSVYKKMNVLKGLYTTNPKGENGITALASVTDFERSAVVQADMFLSKGGNIKKLRKNVASILDNPDSKISTWYKTAKAYQLTYDMPKSKAVKLTKKAINDWVLDSSKLIK